MGEFDSYLSKESRENVLLERISRFALEGYQYEMNLKFAVESNDVAGAEKARDAIESLKKAIRLHSEELEALKETVE